MDYVFVLGRESTLSAIEAVLTLKASGFSVEIKEVTPMALIVTCDTELPASFLNKLGGTSRIARMVKTGDKTWEVADILEHLAPTSTKRTIGLSALGSRQNLKELALQIKKAVKQRGEKLRFVLPSGRGSTLNAAQVIFNQLTVAPHAEFLLIQGAKTNYLAQTVQIQNITDYEKRDSLRPVRDARVGMVPPKLAQMMINMVAAHTSSTPPLTLLDPFCGLGTIIQEGWLLGHQMIGSDSNSDMIQATDTNMAYIARQFGIAAELTPKTFVQDATQPFPADLRNTIDVIVTEPYLGRPLTTPLSEREQETHFYDLGRLYLTFFQNVSALLKKDGLLLILLPAFREQFRSPTFSFFPPSFLDEIERLGYRAKQLVPTELASFLPSLSRRQLLYARPDALVGREITLWQKI